MLSPIQVKTIAAKKKLFDKALEMVAVVAEAMAVTVAVMKVMVLVLVLVMVELSTGK